MLGFEQLLSWLASPVAVVVCCLIVGLALVAVRARGLGMVAILFGVALLVVTSLPVVAHALAVHLEQQFPAQSVDGHATADAIVVFGGALSGASPPARPVFDLGPAADRVWFAAALYRAGKAPWVLVAAGDRTPASGRQVEGHAIQEMLVALGVPVAAVRIDAFSRNTRENAAMASELIGEIGARRVLLVTSALHMPRALRLFRRTLSGSGVEVLPASTDIEGLVNDRRGLAGWLPDVGALALSSRAVKEYVALFGMALGLY